MIISFVTEIKSTNSSGLFQAYRDIGNLLQKKGALRVGRSYEMKATFFSSLRDNTIVQCNFDDPDSICGRVSVMIEGHHVHIGAERITADLLMNFRRHKPITFTFREFEFKNFKFRISFNEYEPSRKYGGTIEAKCCCAENASKKHKRACNLDLQELFREFGLTSKELFLPNLGHRWPSDYFEKYRRYHSYTVICSGKKGFHFIADCTRFRTHILNELPTVPRPRLRVSANFDEVEDGVSANNDEQED